MKKQPLRFSLRTLLFAISVVGCILGDLDCDKPINRCPATYTAHFSAGLPSKKFSPLANHRRDGDGNAAWISGVPDPRFRCRSVPSLWSSPGSGQEI